LLADVAVPGIIVEAEKSALAIVAAHLRMPRVRPLLIGTGGCWGWRGVTGKVTDASGARVDQKGPLPDLDRVVWTDRDVVILFDSNAATNDQVKAARRALAAELKTRGAKVRLVELPTEEGINGPDDYVGKHGDDALFSIIDAAPPSDSTSRDGGADKETAATILVRLARESRAEYFQHDDVPYVHVRGGSHRETYKLRARSGRAWLINLFMDAIKKAPASQALADALNILEAMALRGEDIPVYVRIAAHNDRVYIDLGEPLWRAVEVNRTGWRLIDDLPVRFRRPKGLLSLPVPQPGGTVLDLRPYLNVASDCRLHPGHRRLGGLSPRTRTISGVGPEWRAGQCEVDHGAYRQICARSECGAAAQSSARAARSDDRRHQRPRPRLRQPQRFVRLVIGRHLPPVDRRRVHDAGAVYRRRGADFRRRPSHRLKRHPRLRVPSGSGQPLGVRHVAADS
jgi:hypothetical protein